MRPLPFGARAARCLSPALLLLAATGCAGIGKPLSRPAGYEPPKDGPIEEDEKAGPDPFAIDGLLREEQLPLLKGPQPAFADVALADAPAGVPAPPATCEAWAKHPAGKATCADLPAAKAKLDAALALDDATKRDQALAEAELCTALPAGLVRSLRVELAPRECGDALVRPFFAAKPEKVPGAIHHALVGQALGARLRRAVTPPPSLEAPFSKDRVLAHHKGPLKEWLEAQARSIEALSVQGVKLGGFGKGVVASEAGTADLRLVEAVRGVPIPDEFKADQELTDTYYASLDEAMEPRKARGRDGALVGLREMSSAGVLRDARSDETRKLLGSIYGGRRVDALDTLAFPPMPELPRATVDQRLAAKLPTFHAGFVLPPEAALDPAILRALLERGLPLPHRALLKEKQKELTPAVRLLLARGRVALGARYWRAVELDEAIAQLNAIPADDRTPEHRLFLALSIALRKGPDDLVDLMKAAGAAPTKFGDVRALDVVANESGALSGHAAFDSALIRELAAPRAAPAGYFQDVASRWRKAARLVKNAEAAKVAEDRAEAMEAVAREQR